jgi:hypothetical protein
MDTQGSLWSTAATTSTTSSGTSNSLPSYGAHYAEVVPSSGGFPQARSSSTSTVKWSDLSKPLLSDQPQMSLSSPPLPPPISTMIFPPPPPPLKQTFKSSLLARESQKLSYQPKKPSSSQSKVEVEFEVDDDDDRGQAIKYMRGTPTPSRNPTPTIHRQSTASHLVTEDLTSSDRWTKMRTIRVQTYGRRLFETTATIFQQRILQVQDTEKLKSAFAYIGNTCAIKAQGEDEPDLMDGIMFDAGERETFIVALLNSLTTTCVTQEKTATTPEISFEVGIKRDVHSLFPVLYGIFWMTITEGFRLWKEDWDEFHR